MDVVLGSTTPTLIVVTHNGSAGVVIAPWLRLPRIAPAYAGFRVGPGSITHLHEDDYVHHRALVDLGDTAHLQQR